MCNRLLKTGTIFIIITTPTCLLSGTSSLDMRIWFPSPYLWSQWLEGICRSTTYYLKYMLHITTDNRRLWGCRCLINTDIEQCVEAVSCSVDGRYQQLIRRNTPEILLSDHNTMNQSEEEAISATPDPLFVVTNLCVSNAQPVYSCIHPNRDQIRSRVQDLKSPSIQIAFYSLTLMFDLLCRMMHVWLWHDKRLTGPLKPPFDMCM